MVKDFPKISVIIPVYNTEDYILTCVKSVLEQNYTNIELILVNDGSTDSSGDICKKIAMDDNRVKVFHQKNQGASAARNNGIKNSTGDFIMFLDSDDFWIDDCLDNVVNKLKELKYDIDVIFFKHANILNDEGKLSDFWGYDFDVLGRDELAKYISQQKKVAVSACLKVLNSKLFQNERLYFEEGLLAEDIDWFFNLITIAEKYTTLEDGIYCYRKTPNSASKSVEPQRIKDYTYILNKWIKNAELAERMGIKREYLYNMIGYEYEVLISTLYNYDKVTRKEYLPILKELFWLENYRNGMRSKLIKLIRGNFGFAVTCKVLNFYLKYR